MMIVWDTERLELQGEPQELERHGEFRLNLRDDNGRLRFRSPLVARFFDRETGITFLFMVNHLARGDGSARREQAQGLREWARDQTESVVSVGDFNFDFSFREGDNRGNRAFDLFLEDDVWVWIEPAEFVDTNWADRNPSASLREDRFPETILDFVFVAGPARGWRSTSAVVLRADDFPDTGRTSDHRPVEASLDPAGFAPSPLHDSIDAMRGQLSQMEDMLDELRHKLDTMEEQLPPQ